MYFPSAERRLAKTTPAVPPPTITKSHFLTSAFESIFVEAGDAYFPGEYSPGQNEPFGMAPGIMVGIFTFVGRGPSICCRVYLSVSFGLWSWPICFWLPAVAEKDVIGCHRSLILARAGAIKILCLSTSIPMSSSLEAANLFGVKDKVVLITGGSRGIGKMV